MKELTCIVIGGGYAGIHAVKAIQKANAPERRLRIILIDRQPFHLRKVLLFKPAAGDADISIPFAKLFSSGVQFIQGTVLKVQSVDKRLQYQDADGNEHGINYDLLVLAMGSIVRRPELEQGGIALTDAAAAAHIHEQWRENLRQATVETREDERQRLMAIAVAGAGISGIESSAELAYAMREEASRLGLNPKEIQVHLVNSQSRLFPEGPAKVARKLEGALRACGVSVLHGAKALQYKDGSLMLSNGDCLPVGLCVWTLGLQPNPMLRRLNLPVTPEGQLIVDGCYRVEDAPGVYAIGDCARVIDPVSGKTDRMTCKEGSAQAKRLGNILSADLRGRHAPSHKAFIDFYCFALGPQRGMVWTRQWGLDIMIEGKLGWKLRKLTWDIASLIK